MVVGGEPPPRAWSQTCMRRSSCAGASQTACHPAVNKLPPPHRGQSQDAMLCNAVGLEARAEARKGSAPRKDSTPPRSPSVVPDVHVRQLRPHALLQLQNHVELWRARWHTQSRGQLKYFSWPGMMCCCACAARHVRRQRTPVGSIELNSRAEQSPCGLACASRAFHSRRVQHMHHIRRAQHTRIT